MNPNRTNLPNAEMIGELHNMLDQLVVEAARRGVYGKIELTVAVEDGILQRNAEGKFERKFRPAGKRGGANRETNG